MPDNDKTTAWVMTPVIYLVAAYASVGEFVKFKRHWRNVDGSCRIVTHPRFNS